MKIVLLVLLGLLPSPFVFAAATNIQRKLNQELFISYEPSTTVTDYAAIDLDLRDIINELSKGTVDGRENARRIYSEGTYSKSYAILTLDPPLEVDVAEGTTMLGTTISGRQVLGTARKDVAQGATSIDFQYHASTIQEQWTDCHVGGSPTPTLDGCLAATGAVDIGELGEYAYTYKPQEQNKNAHTFQDFSLDAKNKMQDCDPGCPMPTFSKYLDFYGIPNYADNWVMSAFNQTSTTFREGNANFSRYTGEKEEGANEAIIKGATVLNLWMYVQKEMQHAAAMCTAGQECTGADCSNLDRLHAWDKAVAFYTGSEPKLNRNRGFLLYSLAQQFCGVFGTCSMDAKHQGLANANVEIFRSFQSGKEELLMENCDGVSNNVQRIIQLMTIPLIQGVLKYTYELENQLVNDYNRAKVEADAATYSAALLPLVFDCKSSDAHMLYETMSIANVRVPNFKLVKSLLEENYQCLGVTCFDVGGLVQLAQDGAYMDGAEPCGYVKPTNSGTAAPGAASSTASTTASSAASKTRNKHQDGPDVGLAAGISITVVIVLLLLATALSRKGGQHRQPELNPAEVEWT